MAHELIQIGRIKIKGLSRLGDATTSDIRRALDKAESKAQKVCDKLDDPLKAVGCRIGALTAIGTIRDELAREIEGVRLNGLGIIVDPEEDCKKGFERIIVTSPRNKSVHICRLAPGYRKKDAPEGEPAHKGPLRRLKKFGPGIEHSEILPVREYKVRKAERRLTE
jgi:hypothetical protein